MAVTTSHRRALPSGGAVHIEGTPGAPGLLFLHGVGGGAWSWHAQRAALQPACRLYVWEARGHGDAAAVADAGLADYYRDAQEALAVANGGSPGGVGIVAHSMGGLLAFALAADMPKDVAGLFLVDPVYSNGTDDAYGHFAPWAGRIALFLCEPLLRSFDRNGPASRFIARGLFKGAFENRERMERAWVDQRRQIPFEYPRMLRESFTRPSGFELRDFANELSVPVWLLDVKRDGRSRFPALVETLRRRLGSQFHAESLAGGHYLQLDRPEEVNRRLLEFVRTVFRV